MDCGKGRDKMLLECCNWALGVDSVSVGWDKVVVHRVTLNVCFDSLEILIVHNLEHG